MLRTSHGLLFVAFTSLSWTGHTWADWHGKSIYFLMTDRFAPSVRDGGAIEQQCTGDLRCGGTLRGVMQRLDYIQSMGFDAIWITPVAEQVPADWGQGWRTEAYHGYWARNLYEVDSHLGTKQDLQDLVNEIHRRGMLFMLDVAPNHMGPIKREKLENFVPFNHESHYHTLNKLANESFLDYAKHPVLNSIPYCWTGMFNCKGYNQTLVEMGWFGDLGDLNQENPFVASKLKSWIKEMVSNYSIDGLRMDTAPYMPHWFLKEFQEAAGVSIIGEATSFNISYLISYQHVLQAMFNFPQWHKMRDVFVNNGSLTHLASRMKLIDTAGFPDLGLLSNFVDNQDQPRFLSQRNDVVLLKNQLTLVMLQRGVPVVYYGTEQAFAQKDPRDSLWPHYGQTGDMYLFIRELNMIRKTYLTPGGQQIVFADDHSLAFTHGGLIVIVTNVGSRATPLQVCLPAAILQGTSNLFGPQPFASAKNDEMCVHLLDGHPAVLVAQTSYRATSAKGRPMKGHSAMMEAAPAIQQYGLAGFAFAFGASVASLIAWRCQGANEKLASKSARLLG